MAVLQPLEDRRSALQDAIRSSVRNIMLISPFIDATGVRTVVRSKPADTTLQVLTRFEYDVMEPDAIEMLLDAGALLRTLVRSHSDAVGRPQWELDNWTLPMALDETLTDFHRRAVEYKRDHE